MTEACLPDAYQAFLENPTRDHHRRACRSILAEPGFDRHSLEWIELSKRCAEGRFEEALDQSYAMWPTWKLSPRFHLLVGFAASRLGDRSEEELSRFQFQTCLDGLLGTGDGTARSPYEVLHISDQYDVIRALGFSGRGQRTVARRGRCLSVVSCHEGTRVWFDVGPVPVKKRRLRELNRWVDQTPSQILHHF
jgi:hypothetical protein